MEITFAAVLFEEIEREVREHLASLPSKIEAFLEEHIRHSLHLRIAIDDRPAGYASIHNESLITQFALSEPYRVHGQPVFARLRKMEQVTSAFVPTCDEFYLAHALDEHRQMLRQAYFFSATAAGMTRQPPVGYRLTAATPGDAARIRELTGDFFAPIEERIARDELFLNRRGDELVGFGIREMSRLYPKTASIGMFTLEPYRGAGVGSATIAHLIAKCAAEDIHPVAGCWYYNHRSKRTLERAGMSTVTRLLRIEF
jgi:GNAT superfamily N-acetyltransferase